jgi:competence protein ComEC
MPVGAFALMIAGGLWLCLWRTRWRRLGLVPFTAGALWTLATPAPDLLVTGDGRHLAVRSGEGTVAILRPRAGDYVRDLLAESAGFDADPSELDAGAASACSRDLCVAHIDRSGRRWTVLATRTRHYVDITEMQRACAAADIVVSERRLPRTCRPLWLKADRDFFARTGGIAVTLGQRPGVATVAAQSGLHPWANQGLR